MNDILRQIAKPYIFLFGEGAFPILLSFLSSSTLYGYYFAVESASFIGLLKEYLSVFHTPMVLLFKLVSFLIFFLFLYFLFSKTFLKILNNAVFNWLSIIALLYFAYNISPTATYTFVGIGLILLLYKYLIKGNDFTYDFSSTPFGDSRWSNFGELKQAQLNEEDGFLLGRDDETGEVIGFKGEGHVLTVAKTGAGKGVGVIVPNLLQYGGSIIVVDPKGENFIRSVFARVHRFNQEICLVDPFGEVHKQIQRQLKRLEILNQENPTSTHHQDIKNFYKDLLDKVRPPSMEEPFSEKYRNPGAYNKGFNPLHFIENLVKDGNYPEVFDQANIIANMLVVKSAERDPHWDEKAKMVIKNVIIFLCLHETCSQEPKTLVNVRDLVYEIFEDGESIEGFNRECSTSKFSHYLSKIGIEFSLMADEERLSVLSTVLRHLEFIDSPLVNNNLSRSDFNLLDIKSTKKSVYLVLPANKLDAYNRLMRLWVSTVVNSISISPEPPRERILMIVDEMAQLGKMEPLLQAVSLLRGYGLNLWMIFQDISQLKSIYGENHWKTFSSNARIQQFFGISDNETAEYVSQLSGMTTVVTRSENFNTNGNGFGASSSHSYSAQERKLLYPDKLYRTNLQFIFTEGLFPIKARKMKFFSDGLFKVGEHLPFQLREETKSYF